MEIPQIDFGAFLTYSPYGESENALRSKTVRTQLKQDEVVNYGGTQQLMSEYLSEMIRNRIETLPFRNFFNNVTILVPAPSSSLLTPNSLWVPQRLANALVRRGLGKDVGTCLERSKAIPKSSSSKPENRPKVTVQYDSMTVQKIIDEPNEIVVIDDIVTRGTTLLGSINLLHDSFPNTKIRGFAFMRTMTTPSEFEKIVNPCIGKIKLRDDGWPLRRP